jgi:hypothetical protein
VSLRVTDEVQTTMRPFDPFLRLAVVAQRRALREPPLRAPEALWQV